MILIEPASNTPRNLEDAVIFASQMRAVGYDVHIGKHVIEEDTAVSLKYATLPFLVDAQRETIETLFVIGAHAVNDAQLLHLRKLKFDEGAKVYLFGAFESQQEQIAAKSKYSYVTVSAPVAVDLFDKPMVSASGSGAPCHGVALPVMPEAERVGVAIVAPILADDQETILSDYMGLAAARDYKAILATSGKQKTLWLNQVPARAAVYQYSDLSPASLTRMSQITVLTHDGDDNTWASTVMNNALASGQVVIDATPSQVFSLGSSQILSGPGHISHLHSYLREIILPNLDGLLDERRDAGADVGRTLSGFLATEDIAPSEPAPVPLRERGAGRVWFMPTNGVGLGHAQRGTLVAKHLSKAAKPAFAAFPSCVPLVTSAGYDAMPLVSRSSLHRDGFAHDLVNYRRLCASIGQSDTFVFDGGYIFDSVFRHLTENDLTAIWLRRGLWPAGQDNRIPLDREKIFKRVIAPSEAFEELNNPLSGGAHVRNVGPIVQRFEDDALKAKTRAALQEEFGRSFETLSITMLGGGVAADLSAHIQAACAEFERRAGHLNLIVVWPSAVVNPVFHGWSNSQVVSSKQAGLLAYASDFIISATGYNSFHEVLYNKIPAILIPQAASYMDDQAARCDAAAERGVAAFVKANAPSSLVREIGRFLDRGRAEELRAALNALELPDAGNAEAARLIEEVRG
jgi:hypothetical protein